jgi:hypothetical protein
MKTALALVMIAWLFGSAADAQEPVQTLSGDEVRAWRADLRYMAAEMERTHRNLYHSVTREQFARLVDALDSRIPLLARHEVIVALAQLVAAVGDGHTNIYPTRDLVVGFHELPVTLTFFGDDLRIRAAHRIQQSLVGARVVRIGSMNVSDAYSAVKTMIGRDNEQGARYWAQYLLGIPEVLHALKITPTAADVPLTLMTDAGTESVVLHPFGPVRMMAGDTATLFDRRDEWVDARDQAGQPDPAWLRHTDDLFHFEHVGRVLYVQINQVLDKPTETLARFAGRLHDEVTATRPAKVAIDLRLNRGGNGTLTAPLIRALIQSQNVDVEGRLFAIIGNATFSAAQMLVDELEKYTKVTFVGEPTGSRGNVYSDSRRITLPNSGLTVRVSVYYWQYWHPADQRTATAPQIPAPMTFEAYRANEDPSMTAIARVP